MDEHFERVSGTDESDFSEIEEYTEHFSSSSDSESSDNGFSHELYVDKNNVLWSSVAPLNTKSTKENILNKPPGVTAFASSRVLNLLDCFSLFFGEKFYHTVVTHSNKFGHSHYGKKWKQLNIDEIKAYMGILIYMSIFKSKMESLKQLWSLDKGREIFRKIMPLERFIQINRSLHFDDFETRISRRENDKFCPIREIFDEWKSVLPMCLVPSADLTVDEQLVSFRGRCPFKQYMPSKPAVYGIKFFLLTDPQTNFTHNISVYLGKNKDSRNNKNIGERVVLDLCSYLKGSGRNIVCDNFFTSIPLGNQLLDLGLTLLGTLRHNKRDIPPILKPNKAKEVYSSLFVFHSKKMMVSYTPKKNKSVILLATSSNNTNLCQERSKKPEVIVHYNKNKGGVDTVDRIISMTSVKRYSRRWPMVVFYNMIDLSLINSFYL